MGRPYTVLAIVEAKPGVETDLKQLLLNVVGPSRSESTCLEYRVHQDLNTPTRFFLYENWSSKEAHGKQFEKPYIKELLEKATELLSKPYEIIFGNEL